MEKKDQVNQNPADIRQEEKLRVEETTPKTRQDGKRLSDEEKNTIIKMIRSTGAEKAPSVLKPKPSLPKEQISKTLKEKILKLMRDGSPVSKAVHEPVARADKEKPILSEAER
ncbi:hypothetical protein MNBD_BACTEROID07-760, partial [hydrothermal vent metagenome]